jgi:hypothetical protein
LLDPLGLLALASSRVLSEASITAWSGFGADKLYRVEGRIGKFDYSYVSTFINFCIWFYKFILVSTLALFSTSPVICVGKFSLLPSKEAGLELISLEGM